MEKENNNAKNKIYILCDPSDHKFIGAYTDKTRAEEDWDFYEAENKGRDCYMFEEIINESGLIKYLKAVMSCGECSSIEKEE